MHTLTVDLGERSYPIHIGEGALRGLGAFVAARLKARRCLLVSDTRVAPLYGGTATASLRAAGFTVTHHTIPEGEPSKSIDQFMAIQDGLVAMAADRSTPVVALGGGVVGDLAGFAASCYMRGVPFVQVPTTLLAQVDSSVGGKTAINHPEAKNTIGCFYQPQLVIADTATLATLEPRQLLAGFAEVVKYGVIWDPELFAQLERDLDAILALEPEALAPVIHRCCAIKAEVVSRDEREGGLRAILNFGHTLGHAVEALAGYGEVLHGEAVAMGMVAAARLGESLGVSEVGTAERIETLLSRAGLPTAFPALPAARLLETLTHDKKAVAGIPRFVLARRIGAVEIVDQVGETAILEVAGAE